MYEILVNNFNSSDSGNWNDYVEYETTPHSPFSAAITAKYQRLPVHACSGTALKHFPHHNPGVLHKVLTGNTLFSRPLRTLHQTFRPTSHMTEAWDIHSKNVPKKRANVPLVTVFSFTGWHVFVPAGINFCRLK